MNTEIRNTQSQLKDVEKLLKLDPGNTELMAQKHRLLGQAVSETKEKLETLKTAAEQANDALARGEISQSQYDALQREIIETENNLRDLERQAGQSAVRVVAADLYRNPFYPVCRHTNTPLTAQKKPGCPGVIKKIQICG